MPLPDWAPAFLAALAETNSVAAAAREAGISRSHPYYLRKRDPEFAAAFDQALARPLRTDLAMVKAQAARAAAYRETVQKLWDDGKTPKEIAEALGWTTDKPASLISMQRTRRGYKHAYRLSPEHIAKLQTNAAERMARSRAARRPPG